MIKITYFVHGTTTDNEKGISSGWSDVELSALGVKQSIALKEQTKDIKFDVVFCSDLQRAQTSAKLAWDGIYPINSLSTCFCVARPGSKLSLKTGEK